MNHGLYKPAGEWNHWGESNPFGLLGDPHYNDPGYETPHHGANIASHYAGNRDLPNVDPSQVIGPMETRGDRLEILSSLRQNADSVSDTGGVRCGATSLVAAAIYGGGTGGLSNLINATEAYEETYEARLRKAGIKVTDDEPVDLAAAQAKIDHGLGSQLSGAEQRALDRHHMDEIKAKIADGEPLTQGDMEALQDGVYGVLNHVFGGVDEKGADRDAVGIGGATMADFVRSSPEMRKMFQQNDMHIEDIKSPGLFKHFVLGIGTREGEPEGQRNMYYDPLGRVDDTGALASQLIYGKAAREDYRAVTHSEIDGGGRTERPVAWGDY